MGLLSTFANHCSFQNILLRMGPEGPGRGRGLGSQRSWLKSYSRTPPSACDNVAMVVLSLACKPRKPCVYKHSHKQREKFLEWLHKPEQERAGIQQELSFPDPESITSKLCVLGGDPGGQGKLLPTFLGPCPTWLPD